MDSQNLLELLQQGSPATLMADLSWKSGAKNFRAQQIKILVSRNVGDAGVGTPSDLPDLKATQQQAEDGVDNDHWMTPLRTAQAIDKRVQLQTPDQSLNKEDGVQFLSVSAENVTSQVFTGTAGAGQNNEEWNTPSSGGAPGMLLLNGGNGAGFYPGSGGNAGSINVSGGNCSSATRSGNGGSIDLSGGPGYSEDDGGSIITRAGGGSIDTTGTGYIDLGYEGTRAGNGFASTRTHLYGQATERREIALPDASGTLVLASQAVLQGEKGVANGVPILDAGGKVPVSMLPSTVMEYLGVWNAATNTPALSDGMIGITGGSVYNVSVAGTVNFGHGPITFQVGDWAIYNGTKWQQSPASDEVISVNGKAGVVTLTSDDVPDGQTNKYFTASRVLSCVLTGITTATNAAITATDTILVALGKLQAQLNSKVSTDGTVANVVRLSQAQYSALGTNVSETTLYIII